VIVATGGIEQSGPYLVTGKHNVVLRGTTQAIARKLGNALVAPIIGFVPEGDFDPPTSWMQYPGTVGVSVATFEKLMIDVCASMRAHGFKNIVLIGDHGESQDAMRHVAELLSTKWKDGKARVIYVPEYYNYEDVDRWLEKQGIRQTDEGWHDDFGVTAIMMAVDPNSVRAPQRIKAGKFRINGVDLAPAEQTIDWGRKIIELRAHPIVVQTSSLQSAARMAAPLFRRFPISQLPARRRLGWSILPKGDILPGCLARGQC
jgi:creatinine amidohydrolase/Fe(II)-dependent formamide hydrolase-like protein